MRPEWARLERGRGAEVWAAASNRFGFQILGPHLEELAREWVWLHADPDLLGGTPDRVLAGC